MPYELEEIQQKEKITPQKKIANNFIQNVIANNTESALKIVWYLASVLNKCDLEKEINTFTIKEKEIEKATGITSTTIRRNLKSMMKTTITFIDEKNRVDKYRNLIPALDIKYNGTIDIKVFTSIAKMIIDVVHDNTTFIDIPQLLKLNNKHSIRLLPLLKTISRYDESRGIKRQRTESLQFWNGLFGTKYKVLKYIDTKILSKIKEELDSNSTLTFTYTCNKRPVGKGRPGIQDITIIPVEKKSSKNKTPTEESTPIKKSQTLEDIKRDKFIHIESKEILQEIEQLVTDENYVTEMRIFIDYCVQNNKRYESYSRSFLNHLIKKRSIEML